MDGIDTKIVKSCNSDVNNNNKTININRKLITSIDPELNIKTWLYFVLCEVTKVSSTRENFRSRTLYLAEYTEMCIEHELRQL